MPADANASGLGGGFGANGVARAPDSFVGENGSVGINGSSRSRDATTPRCVAIVSDGSARWASANNLSMSDGHEAAADIVIARIADALRLGISQLTLYAFSTENWTRPEAEVHALLEMLATRINADTPALHDDNVRIRFIGKRSRTGRALAKAMTDAERLTSHNSLLTVFIAFDYGGRDEIIRAAKRYAGGGEAAFSRLLYDPEMRDPDLVIRTSGEKRLSNFLLWQSAYSELIFRQELWPDFSRTSFEECLAEYAERRRRFGGRDVPMLPPTHV
jgi:undecaprenyl diphosphate synthase